MRNVSSYESDVSRALSAYAEYQAALKTFEFDKIQYTQEVLTAQMFRLWISPTFLWAKFFSDLATVHRKGNLKDIEKENE